MRLSLTLLCLALPAALPAQTFTTGPCLPAEQRNADGNWYSGHHTSACEDRATTLPAPSRLDLKSFNGAIEVLGEDRPDIALEAIVVAQADSAAQARDLLREITVTTSPTIEARGPQQPSREGGPQWHINYHLRVPRALAAHLLTFNGPVTLTALTGTVNAQTTNGPLTLRDLAGDITVLTTNGPIDITLAGGQWNGAGLSATTTNGPITLSAAPNYSAHLTADTTHGPIAIPSQHPTTNHLDTDLGHGGAPIRLQTTNGGIALSSR